MNESIEIPDTPEERAVLIAQLEEQIALNERRMAENEVESALLRALIAVRRKRLCS